MSLTYNQAIEELANIPATKEALLRVTTEFGKNSTLSLIYLTINNCFSRFNTI